MDAISSDRVHFKELILSEILHAKKSNAVTGSATVTVASKMPFGFTLVLYDFITRHEPVMGGGVREFKIAEKRRGVPEYHLAGNSYAQNVGPQVEIRSGFALTRDIPKDIWLEWLEQNKEADYVVNKVIFAHEEYASAIAEALEYKDKKTGLERIDPTKTIQMGRGTQVKSAAS